MHFERRQLLDSRCEEKIETIDKRIKLRVCTILVLQILTGITAVSTVALFVVPNMFDYVLRYYG